MTYKAKTKRISLLEFRAWLEGVEELQPKDWAPNLEQWKLIRAKIDAIGAKEGAVEAEAAKPAAKPTKQYVPNTLLKQPQQVQATPPASENPLLNGGFIPPPEIEGVPNLPYDGQFHRTGTKL